MIVMFHLIWLQFFPICRIHTIPFVFVLYSWLAEYPLATRTSASTLLTSGARF